MDDLRTHRQIRLRDGRQLGYAEYGVPDGKPVIYFHGFPSSRLDWQLFDNINELRQLNVRVIAPDRPGYGLSSYQPGRKLMDWPADVVELADKLQLEYFSVLGISGGGPYAAACAYGIGSRSVKSGIVCGMGPREAPGMQSGLSWAIPGMNPINRWFTLWLTKLGLDRDPDRFVSQSKAAVSEPDRLLLENPQLAAWFTDGMREAFRAGIKGASQEAALFTLPWGFSLTKILTTVHLWHGGQDNNVPLSVGQYVAKTIPNCQDTFLEGEGHFTLPRNHLSEILSVLVG